jgi:hypothetical protein
MKCMQNNNKWLYFARKPGGLKTKMCKKNRMFFSFFEPRRAIKSDSIFCIQRTVGFLKIRALLLFCIHFIHVEAASGLQSLPKPILNN